MDSLYDLLDLSTESVKDRLQDNELPLEAYFEAPYELESHLDAVELLEMQIANVEQAVAKLEVGGVKMNAAALAVFEATMNMAAPSVLLGEGFGATLSTEDNAEDQVVLSTESIKEKLVAGKNKARDLIMKAINFVMDYWRKFRTGTDKLVKKLEEAKGKAKDVDVKSASDALFIGNKVISAGGVSSTVKEVMKYGIALKNADASIAGSMDFFGAKKVTFSGKDGKFAYKEEAANPSSKEVKMSKADVEAVLDACKAGAESIGKIDHKGVTDAIQKKVEAGREEGSTANPAYFAKALRTLTVKMPAAAASAMSKVPGGLGL